MADTFSTYLHASDAARRLGVSPKTLRLYEQQGLLAPQRTAAGYRAYSPAQMRRAADIVALRALGLSLAQVAEVVAGQPGGLAQALAAHEAALDRALRTQVGQLERVRSLRADLARGQAPAPGAVAQLVASTEVPVVGFVLPWPWGGEWFALHDIRPLNYLIGPLGSGKTRLAMCLAEAIPGGAFLGLDRSTTAAAWTSVGPDVDAALAVRIQQSLAWLVGEGATPSDALTALLAGLEKEGPSVLAIDMVEQGLDQATQEAVITLLRQRAKAGARPLFLMTRSSAILDLESVGLEESIILCPANHSPPMRVAPYSGAPGYEAVATCLASPEVRQRTAGVVAWRPTMV